MATHSSIHAWKIPWTEEPGGLQFMGSQKVGHDFTSLTAVDQMCMCVKLFQFWLSLCNPMDCSPAGFSVHGICQTRILEWVAMPSRGSS